MKKLILSLAALAALASCSSNEENENLEINNNDPVEIKVGRASLEATTKAPIEGTIGSATLSSFTPKVLASGTADNYSNVLANGNGTITFTDNGTTVKGFDTNPVYFPGNGIAYLVGLYPVDGWSDFTTEGTITINGNNDIMAAKQVTTTKDEVLAGTFQTLAFNHLLSKLQVNIVADVEASIAGWGKITNIQLSKALTDAPNTTATVNLKEGTATYGGAKQALDFYKWDGSSYSDNKFSTDGQTLTTTPTAAAYVLCAPVNATGNDDYTLKIMTETKPEGIEVPLDFVKDEAPVTGLTTGKEFTITLTFKSTVIQALATVQDWVDGGTASGDVQG